MTGTSLSAVRIAARAWTRPLLARMPRVRYVALPRPAVELVTATGGHLLCLVPALVAVWLREPTDAERLEWPDRPDYLADLAALAAEGCAE